nr:hypothetical protein [Tanacetum cinerariifolium]
MNQNFINSNSFSFDQFQPPWHPVIHHPPQEKSEEILHARENLMQSIQTFLRKFNRISFRETPKVLTRAWDKFFDVQHAQPEDIHELLRKLLEDLQIINEELAEYINSPSWNRPTFYDNDDGDDDYFEDINYVEASPLDSELISLEEVQDDILSEKLFNINLLIAKFESLNDNSTPDCVLKSPSLFHIPIKYSDSFFEKSDTSLSYSDNSLHEFETFNDHMEETSSSSTTTHADNSLPEYDSFLFEIEPDHGELTRVVMGTNLGKPRVYVPNVLPTHPTLYQDSDFSSSDDSLGSNLEISFPYGTRNKIFDLGRFFEVQSKRFLSRDTFSPTYVSLPFEDRHYLSFTYVIRTFFLISLIWWNLLFFSPSR